MIQTVHSKAQLSKAYDELYTKAHEAILQINPCKIEYELDGTATCVGTRTNPSRGIQLCCQGCRHLTTSGCRVNSLACALWLCSEVKDTPDGIRALKILVELKQEASKHHVPMNFRASKRENFKSIPSTGLVVIQL